MNVFGNKKIYGFFIVLSLFSSLFFSTAVDYEYSDTETFLYPSLYSEIVDDEDTAFAEPTTIEGLSVIRAVPNPETKKNNSIMALDNYGLNKKAPDIHLDVYKFVTLIYKVEGFIPSAEAAPAIYLGSQSGEIKGGMVITLKRVEDFGSGWRCAYYEIPDLTSKYSTPDIDHFLLHFHLNPYGRKLKVSDIPENAVFYAHAMGFHRTAPDRVAVFPSYMSGYPDGTFGVNGTLSRGEAVEIAARLIGGIPSDFEAKPAFDDVTSDSFFYRSVSFLDSLGLLVPLKNSDKSFNPQDAVTIGEFTALTYLAREYKDNPDTLEATASSHFSASGNSDYLLRSDATYIVNTVFHRVASHIYPENYISFTDIGEEFWGYHEILSSSNTTVHLLRKGQDELSDFIKYENHMPPSEKQYNEGKAKLAEVEALKDKRISEIKSTVSNVSVSGTVYFVSEQFGNDANNGKSENFPIQTIEAVNKLPLKSGDAVLFRRGETFRGGIVAKAGVTYSSYGTHKDKPVLTVSPANFTGAENWTLTNTPNVWKLNTPVMNDVGVVVFNDGECWSEKRIKGRPDFGGSLSELDDDLVMWHDVSQPTGVSGTLYLRSDKGNPGERFHSIEVSPRQNIIRCADNILIDNLTFKYTGAHAVGSGDITGLCVQNCEFEFIGGSWFRTDTFSRYGNAVEVYGGCDGYTVNNCYITQVYDAGMTHQLTKTPEKNCIMKNIKYTNNVVTYTSYPIEYFIGEANEGITHKMENVEISGNIILGTGYGFGDQRPDRDAPANIKAWDSYNESENFVITNNIFGPSKYRMIHMSTGKNEWIPEFSDNVYIQNFESNFGNIGKTLKNYSIDIRDYIVRFSGDENASVYFLRPIEEQ